VGTFPLPGAANRGFYDPGCWRHVAPVGHDDALSECCSGTSMFDLDDTAVCEGASVSAFINESEENRPGSHFAYAVSENSDEGPRIIGSPFVPDSAHLFRSVPAIPHKNVSRRHPSTVADGYHCADGGSHDSSLLQQQPFVAFTAAAPACASFPNY
jgi:hypothetical protein